MSDGFYADRLFGVVGNAKDSMLRKYRNCDVFDDHNPPHFHVLGRNGSALVTIETFEVIALSGRIDLRDALEWAATNQSALWRKWNELN